MTSDKKNISLLANLFVKSGLENIIISPGSRNAPIVVSFANNPMVKAYSIVDERSAAYIALGMSIQTGITTAISCTSGSAVLNYAPAIAEAFYQKVPLLIITADRPSYLIDVGDGQTIRQKDVFSNYIKASYELPLELKTDKDISLAEDIINEALAVCRYPEPGPVHINVPFDEPIYGTAEKEVEGTIQTTEVKSSVPTVETEELAISINNSQKVMFIAGQNDSHSELSLILDSISSKRNIVVLSETTSNLCGNRFIDTIDNVVSTISPDESEDFKPDILISFGGQVVSKMIKRFLRNNKPEQHIHISKSGEQLDTYLCLSKSHTCDPFDFLSHLSGLLMDSKSNYSEIWQNRKRYTSEKRDQYLSNIEYCDLKVFQLIIQSIPDESVIHLGNSTPVRYSQLFGSKKCLNYQSNRGVSGIDGQVSTALGYSLYSNKLNILITGDLGFLYDSNGLMNHYYPPNLKIIVINNQGGGIFRFIPGPDTTPNMEEFFEAQHQWSAEHICKAFSIGYMQLSDMENLSGSISGFLDPDSDINVLEIMTPAKINSEILRDYFRFIKFR